jgi:(p)ppGpp synthase/HD superfamily hydrolase
MTYPVTPEPLVDRAAAFAYGAHAAVGQKRKYTGEPYAVHPQQVAHLVRVAAFGTPEMIAAAHLHDVVEDTGVTLDDLGAIFPNEVIRLVDWMTDKTTLADGNRAVRKAMERERWSGAPPAAQTIKLADAFDNARDILEHDPGFAKVYIAEMRLLLPFLDRGNERLREMLKGVLR